MPIGQIYDDAAALKHRLNRLSPTTATGGTTTPTGSTTGPFFPVKSYLVGTDYDAAVGAANAAAHTAGGIVWFDGGAYTLAALHEITSPGVAWAGPDSGAVTLLPSGSGGIHVHTSSITQAGFLSGLTISGALAPSSVGLHLGDTIGFGLHDVVITGFTGSTGVGLWFDNTFIWTERTTATRLHIDDNKVGMKFSVNGGTNSFADSRFLDFRLNVNAGQTGIYGEDDALIYAGTIQGFCNVVGAGKIVELTGTANVADCLFHFYAEQTSGTGGTGRTLASGTNFNGIGLWKTSGLPDTNGNAFTFPNILTQFIMGNGEGQTGSGVNSHMADIANYAGSGITVTPSMVNVGVREAPYSAMGHARGAGIESPWLCMLNSTGNALVLYKRNVGSGTMLETLRVGLDGGLRMLENANATLVHHADGVVSDGKVMGTDGLGAGNWAYASTPGTVVRKIEIFDANGASIGFIPVYDAVT